jgi:LPXTG-motif cell wall-anchored protein
VTTAAGEEATPPDRAPRAAAQVVTGMGLVALAGLAAWFGRRRRRGEPWPSAEIACSEVDIEAAQASPHLSLVRVPPADAQEERRILPPT